MIEKTALCSFLNKLSRLLKLWLQGSVGLNSMKDKYYSFVDHLFSSSTSQKEMLQHLTFTKVTSVATKIYFWNICVSEQNTKEILKRQKWNLYKNETKHIVWYTTYLYFKKKPQTVYCQIFECYVKYLEKYHEPWRGLWSLICV